MSSILLGLILMANVHSLDEPEVTAGTNALHAQVDQVKPGDSTGSTNGTSANPGVTYSQTPACSRGDGAGPSVFFGCGDRVECGNDGTLYWVWQHDPDGTTRNLGSSCAEPGTSTDPQLLTPGRILEAFEHIPLPESPLEVQPPGGVTLVNFDTILHTDAQPFTETVQLLNRQITFDIEPAQFTWTLGDGSTLSTTDPGRAWRAGLPMSEYVSHRYAKAGTVQLQLTTTWSARWRLPNGPWRPVDGTVDITSPPQPLEVTTARPQLVSYD
ncbi:hypothetical protein GCM10009812_22610 [Nocardioides marinus]|uniref:PKD domain-containing protein n=1 Tax=Nocardioides marinus TaxID=374514 RepID=A0A7Z0C4Q3_9ACTN|nr:hypothetical protein [Nocardioides marinus]NYI11527.1 hypothetical protein [Nocardioides marinus]